MKIEYTPPSSGQNKSPDLLPPAWYSFEVLACYDTNRDGETLVTKEGDPYLKVKVEEASTGSILYHSLFFSNQGGGKLNSFLFATGLAGDQEIELNIKPVDFIGKRFRGLVAVATYNERKYNKIELVKAFDQGQTETASDPEPEDDIPF